MTRIVITADIHLGVQGRLQHTLWALRTLREYCKAAAIDTVVVAGDLFHNRSTLGIDIITAAYEFFTTTKEQYGQNWIVFPGNHDMFLRYSWDINSLKFMNKYMTVIDNVKILQIDEARFWILPFITYEKSYMRVLNRIKRYMNNELENDYLITHIGIRGATLNTCFLRKDWSIVDFTHYTFKRIYTGHFHSRQNIENAWYPGSLIPFKFDEGDVPHGFYDLDLQSGQHKFINIWKAGNKFFPDEEPPPQYRTIKDTELPSIPHEDLKHNLIRIRPSREYSHDEKTKMKTELLDLGARAIHWSQLPRTEERVKVDKQELILSNADLFTKWQEADVKGIKGLDLALLNKLHSEIRHEGDEEYVVNELGE